MSIILAFIIIMLTIIILLLSIALYKIIKSAVYLSKKEKEFIEFAVNMYIKYAEELEITSPEQHEYLVNELEKIKTRYLDE